MFWDKRATQRRPDAPPPDRTAGADLVFLGMAESALSGASLDAVPVKIGDSFHLLPGVALTIGRSELCDVCIRCPHVSQAHALLTFLPGPEFTLALVDMGSRQGTWRGKHRAALHVLAAGDELCLSASYRFRCQPASRSRPTIVLGP